MSTAKKSELILAVDDEPNILKALHYILSKAGYSVLIARDGEEALARIRNERPALIISDIMMPSMDGYELCVQLRSDRSTFLIPFIFLSAKDKLDDRIKGIKTGADAYLIKPFNRNELLALVKTVLQRHKLYIEQTMKDELTSLPNRTYLFKSLTDELARARRYKRNLSIVMMDLDNFKTVNDTYGHLTGDRVLIRIARELKNDIRGQDILGRYGGEEFLIILPETTRTAAAVLVERCRRKIAGISWEKELNLPPLAITLSAGITELVSSDHLIEDLIGRADRVMYRAKMDGRNRVAVG